ncbi:MAG: P83/100 family protein, partial [Spirochaeta sp.]|nr:P83/100 family protein [Spirochaeta sp.]
MMIRRMVLLLTVGVIGAGALPGLEIDRDELRDALDADIEFQNYEGPVEQIDSREAIRGIGRSLGRTVTAETGADYAGRYILRRIIGDETSPLRAADLLELTGDAQVDHIVNLRRIVAGYLEDGWGYQAADADLLSRFITIYNAVHRGDLSFFSARYRAAVIDALDSDRVGLATSYRQWAGQTQLVIPIRPERRAGDLDAVDPGQLVDRAVIAELRTRADLGIEDRKAIIEFIERVIEERTEVIAEEREEIEAEQQEIDERRAEIDEEIDEREEAEPDTAPAADEPQPTAEPDAEPDAAPPADDADEADEADEAAPP